MYAWIMPLSGEGYQTHEAWHLTVICVLYLRRSVSISALLLARTSASAAAFSCMLKWSDVLYAVSSSSAPRLDRSRLELSAVSAMAVPRILLSETLRARQVCDFKISAFWTSGEF